MLCSGIICGSLMMNFFFDLVFQFRHFLNGTNIIGVFPGTKWNTQYDKPLIVGAHWDTVETSSGKRNMIMA